MVQWIFYSNLPPVWSVLLPTAWVTFENVYFQNLRELHFEPSLVLWRKAGHSNKYGSGIKANCQCVIRRWSDYQLETKMILSLFTFASDSVGQLWTISSPAHILLQTLNECLSWSISERIWLWSDLTDVDDTIKLWMTHGSPNKAIQSINCIPCSFKWT